MDNATTLEAEKPEAQAAPLGLAYQMVISADRSEWRFTYLGEQCLALNGVSAEAVMADPTLLYDMILPDHREAFLAAELHSQATGKAFDMEVPIRRPDGQVRWHRITSQPRLLPDGSTVWDGLQIDVTERRQMAEALEAQRRRLEVAVEATKLGLWEWRPGGNEVIWSARNYELFGVPRDTPMTLERYMDLVHPDDLPSVAQAYLAAQMKPGGGDLSVEHRLVSPDGEVRWILVSGRVIGGETGPRLVLGTSLDITAQRVADERRDLLMGELAHRAKNGIAVMMAMVHQTGRSAATVAAFEASLTNRLQAMADAQDLVTATGGRPVLLADILKRTLRPFEPERIDIDPGLESVEVAGDLAVGLALLLHEMATNAVKYGALSDEAGRVQIDGGAEGPGRVALTWRERGGPKVETGARQGFGTRLLQSALRPQGGRVEFSFEPAGFTARVEFPHHG